MRVAAIAALTLAPLCAQQYPDAQELTRQAADTLRKLHSVQYTTEMTMETVIAGQNMKMTNELSYAMVTPGKSRMETKGQGLSLLVVSDGETTWTYSSVGNEYTRRSVAMGPQAIMDSMGMGDFMPDPSKLQIVPKTIGEETLVIDGQKHDCWVVRTDMGNMPLPAAAKGAKISAGEITTWMDKKLLMDLQSNTTMTMSMAGGPSIESHIKSVKKSLQIDAPVPDTLFAFTPPEGAKQVEKLSLLGNAGGAPDFSGKPAPDFTLQSVDGKPYRLSSLKGKPVLLDFWATWCGPCRQSTPVVEKLSQEFKDGLVVLGIDGGEELSVVADFLKKKPMAYPALLSGESTVLADYQVKGLPSFVLIDADGKIAAYETGFGGEGMLRGMLEKVGLSKK